MAAVSRALQRNPTLPRERQRRLHPASELEVHCGRIGAPEGRNRQPGGTCAWGATAAAPAAEPVLLLAVFAARNGADSHAVDACPGNAVVTTRLTCSVGAAAARAGLAARGLQALATVQEHFVA